MLNCAEQVQIQKYKTQGYKTPKTGVQTVMLKHPTKQLKKKKKEKKKVCLEWDVMVVVVVMLESRVPMTDTIQVFSQNTHDRHHTSV